MLRSYFYNLIFRERETDRETETETKRQRHREKTFRRTTNFGEISYSMFVIGNAIYM